MSAFAVGVWPKWVCGTKENDEDEVNARWIN